MRSRDARGFPYQAGEFRGKWIKSLNQGIPNAETIDLQAVLQIFGKKHHTVALEG